MKQMITGVLKSVRDMASGEKQAIKVYNQNLRGNSGQLSDAKTILKAGLGKLWANILINTCQAFLMWT